MWWNRSKTPPKSQEGQLRELQVAVAEMQGDFEKVFNLIAKLNGRLRQRDRRALESERAGDGEGDSDGTERLPDLVAPIQAAPAGEERRSDSLTAPVFSKDQLRSFARQRGLLQH